MNHGSLFSGIGGFDLAAEWAGWTNIFHCEINPFGQKILKRYWPDAEQYDDITKTDFSVWRGRIDILTGGFPCQPFSMAGKRKGTEDARHLWPEMLRVIREIQPTWVVGENVSGIISWDGGLVFEQVQIDLENEGYEIIPFILPACGVGAPHRRDRVWFVAHRNSDGFNGCNCKYEVNPSKRGFDALNDISQISVADSIGIGFGGRTEATGNYQSRGIGELVSDGRRNRNEIRSETERCSKITSNPTSIGLQGRKIAGGVREGKESPCREGSESTMRIETDGEFRNAPDPGYPGLQGSELDGTHEGREWKYGESHGATAKFHKISDWSDFPTQPPVRSRNDGVPGGLDGITFPKWRNESIKGFGNAIVPQVVYQIFKAINQYEITQ